MVIPGARSIAGCMVLAALSLATPASGEAPDDSTVVGNTGSARWTIPIEVPPGPGGLAPKLTLVYSSRAGDGPFGVGWTLPLGEVSCSVRHGVPAYINPGGAQCPQFELGGELLNYNPGQDRYHTFVESFRRILHLTASGVNHWEVTSPDGMIQRYGETANSRIIAPSDNVARWLLSSIENAFGKRISFEYDGDPSTATIEAPQVGNTYIRKVSYGPASERVVEFEYEPRTDVIHDFSGGVEGRIAHRATEIHVESNGATHSLRRLGYDLAEIGETQNREQDYSTHRSRLAWTQLFGNHDSAEENCPANDPPGSISACSQPPQQFRYTDPDDFGGTGTQWDSSLFAAPPIGFDVGKRTWPHVRGNPSQIADINGDGLVDIVVADQSQNWGSGGLREVYINTGAGFESSSAWRTALASLTWQAPKVNVSALPPDDFHSVCDATYTTVPSGIYFGDSKWHVPINVQFATGPATHFNPLLPANPYVQLGGNFHLVDLNGDRLPDLVMSVRLSGIHRTHDCNTGNELQTPEFIPAPNDGVVQIAFRNTGAPETGWVEDPSLVEGLPLFGMVRLDGDFAVGAIWGEAGTCPGFIGPWFQAYDPATFPASVAPCIGFADLAPQFTDLNGDGRADLIAAVPARDAHNLIVDNFGNWGTANVATTSSQAWLSREDGSRERDASFDLPFHHAHIAYDWGGSGLGGADSFAVTGDAGVRIVDRNRDGYADVTWVNPYLVPDQQYCQGHQCPWEIPGYPSVVRGVLLNRGAGDGTRYSAWCSSREIVVPNGSVDPCSASSQADRYELPQGERFAVLNYTTPAHTLSQGTELADLNGDGWLDLMPGGFPDGINPPVKAYLFSRDGAPWVEDPRFDPPTYLGSGYILSESKFLPVDSRMLDLDGDGAADFAHGTGGYWGGAATSWIGKRGLSDLLREVRTGRGGTVRITYNTGPRQRDLELEDSAADHADDLDEPLGQVGEAHWARAPVVESITVEGPNRVASTTHYRYADPRWDRKHRSGLGYRLFEETRPDDSVVQSFFYQKHGRAGRLSERIAWDEDRPVHWSQEVWVVLPPTQAENIPGAWPYGTSAEVSHLGRLGSRSSRREYGTAIGQSTGAVQEETFTYDNGYGYNFLSHVHTERPSGGTDRYLDPAAPNTTRWILGLVQEELEEQAVPQGASELSHHVTFTYTGEGRVETQTQHRTPASGGGTANDVDAFAYDGYGNLSQHTDAKGRVTLFGYDPSRSVLVSRTDPAVGSTPGRVTTYDPHPIFAVPVNTHPGYVDVPGEAVELDPFGRVQKRSVLPTSGGSVVASETFFEDGVLPPYVETVEYTSRDLGSSGPFVRTVVFDDGFGGVWKTVRDADVTAQGAARFVGTATYYDPAARISRTTEDISCGTDALCSGLTGELENPAVVTTSDALGRPVSVTTAEGTSLSHYGMATKPIVRTGGLIEAAAVDAVLSQNAEGHLVLRAFDGDRVVAVEECTNSDPDRTSLAGESCAATQGQPNRTLYGYHANGQLEVIYDVEAVAGADWNNPKHRLRYYFDSAGQVTGIDDPDAGTSTTEYDAVGNVERTVNARGQVREHVYDALDRVTRVETLETPDVFTVSYPAGKLQRGSETGPPDSVADFTYDPFGRLWQEYILTDGVTVAALYDYDLLGRPTYIRPLWVNLWGIRYEYDGAFLKQVCQGPEGAGGECSVAIIDDVTYDELGRRDIVHLPQGDRDYVYADDDEDADPSDDETRHLKRDAFAGAETAAMAYTQHDGLGNVLAWSTTSPPGGLTVNDGSYAYDARNRLISWSRNGQPESFQYDPLGNLTQHGAAGQTFTHLTKAHAITQRVEGSTTRDYTYDASGNVAAVQTTENLGAPSTRTYTFDSADRLVCVKSAPGPSCDVLRVVYDLAGRRIYERAGDSTRRFVGDWYVHTTEASGLKAMRTEVFAWGERVAYIDVAETEGSALGLSGLGFEVPPWGLALPPLVALAWCLGLALRGGLLEGVARRPGSAALTSVLIISLAIPFPVRAGGGNPARTTIQRWVLSDKIGSGIVEVDEDGLVTSHTRYKPFGGIDAEAPLPATPGSHFFAGHRQQEETGLHYMQARWQDPVTGTFLSVDPLIVPTDPQSHTGYSYARNNPISFNDPTGMSAGCGPIGVACWGGIPTEVLSYAGAESGYSVESFDSTSFTELELSQAQWLERKRSRAQGSQSEASQDGTAQSGQAPSQNPELDQLMAEYYAESQPKWLLPPKSIAEIEAGSFQVGRPADINTYDAEGNYAGPKYAVFPVGFPAGPSAAALPHIFRAAVGHVNPSTLASMNRFIALFRSVAANPANRNPGVVSQGAAAAGKQGFSQIFRSGSQVWAHVRDGRIVDAGVNAAKSAR